MSFLQEQKYQEKHALLPFMKRIFRYSMSYPKWFWLFVCSIAIVAIVDAVFPLVWLNLIDKVIVPEISAYRSAVQSGENYSVSFSGIIQYALIFLGLGIIQIIGVYYFIYFAGHIQEHVMHKLRKQMFDKLQHLSFSFYDRSALGWLLSRITSDTNRVTELISWGFLEAIWGIMMIVACFTAMFIYNWQLALAILITIPVLIVSSIRIRTLILKYSRASRKINSELTASYNEHINGVEVNKSTAQEDQASGRFQLQSDQMRAASYKASFYTAMYMPMVIFLGSIAAAVVIYLGGIMAVQIPPAITVGVLAAFFGYATRIFEPIMDITRFYAMAQGSLSAGERIFSLIDEPVEIKDKPNAGKFTSIQGEITFEQVKFKYQSAKTPILDQFNLKLKAGESVALVGESGGGKSTIVNLICRFYEPDSGRVLIDGVDYTKNTIQSLRSQLGIVLQTPHLFSGTIRENVMYGSEGKSEEEVINALKIAGAEKFIAKLDEEAGEGGDRLSTGEKQLISFARAILKEPAIFIMDEATSSIDTITESLIQQGIEKIIKKRTSVIIAHRLSTIRNCDRILVIDNGKIIEDGNHHSLMKNQGHYHKLYTNQLRKETSKLLIEGEKP